MAGGVIVVLGQHVIEHRTCDSQRTMPAWYCPLTIAGTMRNDVLTENYDHQRVTFENATIFSLRSGSGLNGRTTRSQHLQLEVSLLQRHRGAPPAASCPVFV